MYKYTECSKNTIFFEVDLYLMRNSGLLSPVMLKWWIVYELHDMRLSEGRAQ